MEPKWWPNQPVLEVKIEGNITDREQAFGITKQMVDDIESSKYSHVIVILDLTALGQSPSGAALLAGNLPQTYKIEHLVMINAPSLFRVATMPLFHLRNKLHYVGSQSEANKKANDLLPKLRN